MDACRSEVGPRGQARCICAASRTATAPRIYCKAWGMDAHLPCVLSPHLINVNISLLTVSLLRIDTRVGIPYRLPQLHNHLTQPIYRGQVRPAVELTKDQRQLQPL